MSMAISERMELEALKRRVEALEAERRPAPMQQPQALKAHNAGRRAIAERLRAEIERIAAESPPSPRLTAKRVLQALSRTHGDELPSERTVRLHLAMIRGNGNAE